MCEVCVVPNLTDEQKKKYRILDNKTNELAGWDFMLLEQELEGLDFEGFDFGFSTTVPGNLDDMFAPAPEKKPKEPEQIKCPHCGMWFDP